MDQENLADHQTRRELQEAFIGYARLAHGWTKADFEHRQTRKCLFFLVTLALIKVWRLRRELQVWFQMCARTMHLREYKV